MEKKIAQKNLPMKNEAKKIFKKPELPKMKNLSPNLALSVLKSVFDAYAEKKRTDLEIERLRTQKEILLEDIKLRYDFYNSVFSKIFSERKLVIDKYFSVIDKGISEGNDSLITSGLENLSKVVSSSPFASFCEFQNQLQSGQAIEL